VVLLAFFHYLKKLKKAYVITLPSVCLCILLSVAGKRLGKHVLATTNTHATIERTKIWLWVPTQPETKKDSAGETNNNLLDLESRRLVLPRTSFLWIL
jgi:hypothetical protein